MNEKQFPSSFSRQSPGFRRASHFFAITFAFGLLLLVFGVGCTQSLTPKLLSASASQLPLRIGTSGDYAPFSIRDLRTDEPRPKATGFSIEVAEAYAERTNRQIRWIDFSWPTLAEDLDADRFDFAISGVTVRPDRSILGRFSLPLTVSGAIALVPDESPIQSTADLSRSGLGIAVNAGGHLERTTRLLFPDAQIVPISNNVQVLPALHRVGIEVVITDTLEAPHWQKRRPGLRAIGPLTQDRKAAWFAVSQAGEARNFDTWLLEAEADGTLATLRERHGLPSVRTAARGSALIASLDERLSLMIDVARAKQILGSPIEHLEREARVLAAAGRGIEQARARRGILAPNADDVRDFYAAQIEAAKAIQRAWTAAAPPATDTNPEDAQARLDQEIRPALIYLGDRIARLVVHMLEVSGPAPTRNELAAALAHHDLSKTRIDAIAAAMNALFQGTPRGDDKGTIR